MKKLILLTALLSGNSLAIDRLANQDYTQVALEDAQTLAGLLEADQETFDKQAFVALRSFVNAIESCKETSIDGDCNERIRSDWSDIEAGQDVEELSNVEEFILTKRLLGFLLRNAEEVWKTF